MKSYQIYLFPIVLISIGLIAISGVEIFGSALLEGAAWKQNVIFALILIFGMLPPTVQSMKTTWMICGYLIAFFMFGGANFIGTVGMVLGLEKIALAILSIFLGFRVWCETWKINKLLMLVPTCTIIAVALLLPIQDKNIIGSGVEALFNWSASKFTSDQGFHIYLGLAGVFAGVSEFILRRIPILLVSKEN